MGTILKDIQLSTDLNALYTPKSAIVTDISADLSSENPATTKATVEYISAVMPEGGGKCKFLSAVDNVSCEMPENWWTLGGSGNKILKGIAVDRNTGTIVMSHYGDTQYLFVSEDNGYSFEALAATGLGSKYPKILFHDDDTNVWYGAKKFLYKSTDISTWTEIPVSLDGSVVELDAEFIKKFDGTFYIGNNFATHGLIYSEDEGATWNKVTFKDLEDNVLTSQPRIGNLAKHDNIFVASTVQDVDQPFAESEYYVYFSIDNGKTFKQSLYNSRANGWVVEWIDGKFIAIAANSSGTEEFNRVYGSTDGENWEIISHLPAPQEYLWFAKSADGKEFVLVSNGAFSSNAYPVVTTDGINWRSLTTFHANYASYQAIYNNIGGIVTTGQDWDSNSNIAYATKASVTVESIDVINAVVNVGKLATTATTAQIATAYNNIIDVLNKLFV